MSEQGTGGVRENRAVIFAEGRLRREKKLLYLWYSGVEEKPVLSLMAGRISGASLLAFVSPYISSHPIPVVIVRG